MYGMQRFEESRSRRYLPAKSIVQVTLQNLQEMGGQGKEEYAHVS
jgi:hypothetical protein